MQAVGEQDDPADPHVVRLPQAPDPQGEVVHAIVDHHGAPIAAGDQPSIVSAQDHGADSRGLPGQDPEQRPIRRRPDADRRVLAGGEEQSAVGREGHRRQLVRVACLNDQIGARRYWFRLPGPQAHRRRDAAHGAEPLLPELRPGLEVAEASCQVRPQFWRMNRDATGLAEGLQQRGVRTSRRGPPPVRGDEGGRRPARPSPPASASRASQSAPPVRLARDWSSAPPSARSPASRRPGTDAGHTR